MKEIMGILKKHKFTCFVLILFTLFVIIGGILTKRVFLKRGNVLYGDRLKEVKDVKFDKDKFLKNVDKTLKSMSFVVNSKADLKIRTFTFVITVKDEASVEQAKTVPPKIMELVEDKYKKVYSFDFFIVKNKKDDYKFPLEATQQYESKMSWIRD